MYHLYFAWSSLELQAILVIVSDLRFIFFEMLAVEVFLVIITALGRLFNNLLARCFLYL